MIINKILIPLIKKENDILEDDIPMIKDEYVIVKSKDNPNFLYLFSKDFFLEDSYFYNIFDLNKTIKKNYGSDVVYIIFDLNDEGNIGYVAGNTKYYADKKYHVKGVINKEKWKQEFKTFLKMFSFVLNIINSKKIIIFVIENDKTINQITKEISQKFEKDYFVERYEKKDFIKILKNIKAHEIKKQIFIPYIIGIIVSALIFGSSVFLVNYKNKKTQEETKNRINAYEKSILSYKKRYYGLKKIYSKKAKILKQLEIKKIYKGTNNG